ncbi:MAG: hypothetical protein ACFE85_16060 [Candidatus Hodarchaeota archaeon]
MRPSRIFRWIVRIFLLVFTLSLSAVSLLGGFSAVTVLDPDSYNINIPDESEYPVSADFNISNPSGMFINIPFNISNVGVYDLNDIVLGFQIRMTFGNVSAGNETTTVEILNENQDFGDVLHGDTLKANFTATNFFNIPDPGTVDWTRSPHALEFYAGFTFSAWYSLRLYRFTVNVANFSIGYYG